MNILPRPIAAVFSEGWGTKKREDARRAMAASERSQAGTFARQSITPECAAMLMAAQGMAEPDPGNYQDLCLFLVVGDAVYLTHAEADTDGSDAILVAATSQKSARVVAQAHRRGEAKYRALGWGGDMVCVVYQRNVDGLYV